MIKRWLQNITNSKLVLGVVDLSKKIVLPGFEGHSLYYVTRFFFKSLTEGAIGVRAASISFRVIMAVLPFFIMLLSVIPYIKIEGFQKNLFNGISQLMPREVFNLIESTVDSMIYYQDSALLSIGFLLTLYYASNSVLAILSAFSTSINVTKRSNFWKQRLVSILLIVVFSVLIFVAVGIITMSQSFERYLVQEQILTGSFQVLIFYLFNYLVTWLLFMVAISILYSVGNPDRKGWRLVSAGTIFSSVLMILVSVAFAYYVNNFGNYNKIYGSLGAVIAFFLWINFNSTILLMGFELNTSIARATTHKKASAEESQGRI